MALAYFMLLCIKHALMACTVPLMFLLQLQEVDLTDESHKATVS